MYCPNCGNELNGEKFCPSCGYSVVKKEEVVTNNGEVNEQTAVNSSQPPKKTNKAGLIVVFLVIFFIAAVSITIIALIFHFAFGFVEKYETKEYIDVGGYKVPSVYKVLGEKREICGISSSSHNKIATAKINYCNNLSDADEDSYVEYLISEENFSYTDGSYKYTLVKEVDGMFISVTIDGSDTIAYSSNDVKDASMGDINIEM